METKKFNMHKWNGKLEIALFHVPLAKNRHRTYINDTKSANNLGTISEGNADVKYSMCYFENHSVHFPESVHFCESQPPSSPRNMSTLL